jgi:pimeloyl-ACP methyl ester carboxylesterase
VAGSLALVLVALIGGFVIWATNPPDPEPAALAALESDDRVEVVAGNGYTFLPTGGSDTGFILYPGGRIDPASYAVPARRIAEAGYLVVIPELTLNLAVLDIEAADDVIASHPDIDAWVVGGHSLGGSMAARYVSDHRQTISGLVLWAAYPDSGTDLSTSDVGATSVFGTRDGLTSLEEIEDSRSRLPTATEFVPINGGNHAQFGNYGPQSGDNPATISAEDQQSQSVAATLRLLRAVGSANS